MSQRFLSLASQEAEVRLAFIDPGKPVQNAYCESFNGKFRDECLSRHYFTSLDDARHIIEAWRTEYNHERPHSALDYKTPQAYRLAWEHENTIESQPENLSLTPAPI